jgi:LysM repeat protein
MDISSLRSSPRLAAPVVLAIFAIALLILVVTSTGGSTSTPTSRASVEKARDLGVGRYTRQEASSTPAPQPPTYVVHNGDTLSSISQKTGLSVTRLQQLNRNIDPQALATGEKLKLR